MLTKADLISVSKLHDLWIPTRLSVAECRKKFDSHNCQSCDTVVSIFESVKPVPLAARSKSTVKTRESPIPRYRKRKNIVKSQARNAHEARTKTARVYSLISARWRNADRLRDTVFPPKPLTRNDAHRIIARHCRSTRPSVFVEAGCAVCGSLVPKRMLTSLDAYRGSLALLIRPGVTRKERFSSSDPIEEVEGPVLADACNSICVDCETLLDNGVVPRTALVRHNWIGPVPSQLKNLTYAEGIMIARVRHNRCVVRVNSGRVRMSANAIMFSQPVLSVLNSLPPSRAEMNEILAFVFMGSAAPTQEDFDRTPMLVRRKKVLDALEWLKLNHEGYQDLEISKENLSSYAERDIPVVVDFRKTSGDDAESVPAGTAGVHEVPHEYGTKTGRCSFAVHGLTG
ncbi:hypothetical protein C8R46DRAFT_913087, partial [Mycena filopes]